MKLKPLGDRVIVKVMEQEEVTASGIVLPDTAKEKPQRGKVLAVGDGRWVEGKRVPLEVAEDDEVLFAKYGGTEVKLEGEDVMILSEHDVLAKVGAASTRTARRKGSTAKSGAAKSKSGSGRSRAKKS